MKTIRTLATTAAAGATVLALASPASATAFTGNVEATLLGTMTTSAGNCTGSTLTGALAPSGSNSTLTINAATFSGCSGATVTAQVPWSGTITPGPAPADGTLLITGFKIKVVATLGITCYYAGNVSAPAYNPANPSRPVPSVNEAQIELKNASASKQSGSNFLCPGTATVSAVYQVKGESSPGSGVYSQTINLI